MRKILALIPFVLFAACGNVDIHLSETAGAGEGGGGMGGAGGGELPSKSCACDRSGDRLQLQWIVGEDGSRMRSSAWLDTELNDSCWFQSLPTGETRCVPNAQTINTYEDATCTIPVYGIVGCSPKSKYAKIETKEPFVPGTCGQTVTAIKYLNVDYGFPVDLQAWYTINGSGACIQIPLPVDAQFVKTNPLEDSTWFVKAISGVGF